MPYEQIPGRPEPGKQPEEVWQATKLRSGLWLNVVDLRAEQAIRFRYQKKTPLIDFGVILDGQIWNQPRTAPPDGTMLNSRAGLGGVLYLPESKGVVEIPAQKKLQILHVHVAPRVLHTLLQEEMGGLPADFKSVVEGGNTHFICRGKMDPAVQSVAHQMVHAPSSAIPRRLFLEGKAMELISLQIAWLSARQGQQRSKPALSPSERNRVQEARDILIRNMASPPTLAELSGRLCLSVNKLECGFRDLFGTSVFGFLKEYKMQRARLLFEEADVNVSEVAWAVGYVNLSHFSQAFKTRFGVLPKKYLQAVRRKRIAA